MSNHLHNYARDCSCGTCIDPDKVKKSFNEKHFSIALMIGGILCFVSYGIFRMLSQYGLAMDTTEQIISGLIVGILATMHFMPLTLHFNTTLYAFYSEDGRLHLHHSNPLNYRDVPWKKMRSRVPYQQIPENQGEAVVGDVLRIRIYNLWRMPWHNTGKILTQGVTGLRVKVRSVNRIRISGPDGDKIGYVRLDQALYIINHFQNLQACFIAGNDLHHAILPSYVAIMHFLEGDRKTRPSKGMGEARQLMSAILDLTSHNISSLVSPQTADMALGKMQGHLAHREQLAADDRRASGRGTLAVST